MIAARRRGRETGDGRAAPAGFEGRRGDGIRVASRPRPRLAGILPATTLGRELVVVAARPRALAIKVGFPLALALPLVLGHAPSFWAATLLTVLTAMVGAVGSAVAIARTRQSGLLTRLALVPRPAWRTVGGWLGAGTLVDALQLLPVIVLVAVAGGGRPGGLVPLGLATLACLVTAATLGAAVSALGGGVGEVLLDVTVVLAPLLYLGGLFTGVPRDGWREAAAAADPFGQLHSALIAALGGQGALSDTGLAAGALLVIAAALAAQGLLGRWILERSR